MSAFLIGTRAVALLHGYLFWSQVVPWSSRTDTNSYSSQLMPSQAVPKWQRQRENDVTKHRTAYTARTALWVDVHGG